MKRLPIIYSDAERIFVRDNCTMSRINLHLSFCDKFNRNDVSAANLTALRKRNGWLTGRTGHFTKGRKFNPKSGTRVANRTSFKKGHRPYNAMNVGDIRVSDGYYLIKVSEPNVWEFLHIALWVDNFGSVPDGFVVTFRDHDRANIDIDNLELLTRTELLHINRLQPSNYAREVQSTIRLLGKLIAKSHNAVRNIENDNKKEC